MTDDDATLAKFATIEKAAADLSIGASRLRAWVRYGRLKLNQATGAKLVRLDDVRAILREPPKAGNPNFTKKGE